MKLFKLLATFLLLENACASLLCTNRTETVIPRADFLFIVDSSSSMCDYISGVKSGFQQLVSSIQNANINATFGILRFGDDPVIFLPLVVGACG